jgi:hypothetical protein
MINTRKNIDWSNGKLCVNLNNKGGLGILDLELQNKCLLSKWLFKLYNENGIWQSLLRNKYVRNKTIGEVTKKATDSHFWESLMNVKDQFLNYGSFKVGVLKLDFRKIDGWETSR